MYEINEVITYPVPGVIVNECEKNTVNKKMRIVNIYEGISGDGLIVDCELLDGSISGIFSCKLLNEVNYKNIDN
jgi:hypothetical protein